MPAVKKGPIIYNSDYAGNLFKRICKKIQLKDEMGIPYVITSHQLRHNGITDRLEEGFKLIEVRDMTGHKSDSMLYQAYYHPKPEKHLEKQKELITDGEIAVAKMKNSPIYFRGRILNLSEEIEKKILDNPRAYQIGDGNRCLGFCTDILNCREGAFECLDCEHFSPNGDELDYYEQGIEFWESKVKECIEKGFRLYQENAEYNLALHRHIVERIKSINC